MKLHVTPDGYFAISIVSAVLVDTVFPVATTVRYPYSLAGILLIIMGIVIVLVTNTLLLKEKTSVKPFENPRILVTSGPFRWSRNPIYLGMAIALLGIAVILGSLSPFIFPMLFVIMIDQSIIPMEERNLERAFGKEYLDYKATARRWL